MADGLEGVIAADTRLSLVDGQAGRLVIAGRDVESLVDGPPFEAVLAMLWDGLVADLPPTAELGRRLGEARASVFRRLAPRVPLVAELAPMDALRALVAQLPDGDGLDTALALAAAPAVLTLPSCARATGGTRLRPIPPEITRPTCSRCWASARTRTAPARSRPISPSSPTMD